MKKEELLEKLRCDIQCMMISDLKYINKDLLYVAIKALHSEDYGIEQWLDAIIYLTGNSIDKNISNEAAKEYLCKFYR